MCEIFPVFKKFFRLGSLADRAHFPLDLLNSIKLKDLDSNCLELEVFAIRSDPLVVVDVVECHLRFLLVIVGRQWLTLDVVLALRLLPLLLAFNFRRRVPLRVFEGCLCLCTLGVILYQKLL